MTIKAVVFDLDDTLISERQYVESGYRHISKILSQRLNKNEIEIYQSLLSLFVQSPINVFNRFFEKNDIQYTVKDIKELVAEYRNHKPAIEFYNDVLPCINSLKKIGIKLGIITDGYANSQRLKLNSLNAYEYFDEIIITDELGRQFWKPHPKPFEIIQKKLGVNFDEMIYVGDNPKKDFFIGKVYPIITIRVIRENSIYANTPYYRGIIERKKIKNLYQLIDII